MTPSHNNERDEIVDGLEEMARSQEKLTVRERIILGTHGMTSDRTGKPLCIGLRSAAEELGFREHCGDCWVSENCLQQARSALLASDSSPTLPPPSEEEAQEPVVRPGSSANELLGQPELPPATAEIGYAFPHADPDFQRHLDAYARLTPDQLMQVLDDLVGDAPNRLDPARYRAVRVRICAIGITLNRMKRVPPALRPTFMLKPGVGKRSAEETVIANDKQIIDLHWLQCAEDRAVGPVTTIDGTFDFERASRWAARRQARSNAADALELGEHEQVLLAALRSKAVAERQRRALAVLRRVPGRIRNELQRPGVRTKLTAAELALAARALALAPENLRRASQVATWIGGPTLGEDRLRKARKWLLERRLLTNSAEETGRARTGE